jgi:hypothetical protein
VLYSQKYFGSIEYVQPYYFYRNETLANDANGNISTRDTLPAYSGEMLNKWTMR